jgi:hypothetical protein
MVQKVPQGASASTSSRGMENISLKFMCDIYGFIYREMLSLNGRKFCFLLSFEYTTLNYADNVAG